MTQSPPSPVNTPTPDPVSAAGRILRGTGFQVGARLWAAVCSMGTWMVLGRALDDAGEGIYTYYYTLALIAMPFVDFGAYGIAVREIAKASASETLVLRFATAYRALMGLVLASGIFGVALWREDFATAAVVGIAAAHLLFQSASTMGAHFQARVQFLPIALPLVIGSTAGLGVSLVLMKMDCETPGPYLLSYGVGMTVQSVLTYVWGARSVSLFGAFPWALARRTFKQMWPIGVSGAATALYFQVDAVVLRDLVNDEAVGEYNHAFRLLTFAVMVPVTFCQALFPVLSRIAQERRDGVLPVVRRAMFTLAGVMMPAAAMAPFLGDSAILMVFKTSSPVSEQCLSLLAVAGVALYLGYPQVSALTAIDRQATFTKIALFVAPVKLGLISVLVPWLGLPGAALASIGAESLVLFCVSLSISRYLGASAWSVSLLRPVLAAIPVGLVAWWFRDLCGVSAVLCALALQAGGILLAGVFPMHLEAGKRT